MNQQNQNIAAIDIGTNSFHLIVVKVNQDGNFEIIDREKDVIRLGEGSGGEIKRILPEATERALVALKRFKLIAHSHNAKIRAVATSAVRESHNKQEFINLVKETTGIDIEVISGYEEARLIYLGILKAVPVYHLKTLIIDIGGGSTELLLGLKGIPIYSSSLKLGAVRLTQKFFADGILSEQKIQECKRWVELSLFQVANGIKKEGFNICVGSSGTIMAAGLLIYARKKNAITSSTILNNFEFTKSELDEVAEDILSKKTIDKRKKIDGLDDKRADIIPAGIIILQTIFELLDLQKMTISGYALREGIVIDELQKNSSDKSKPNLSEIRKESVMHLAQSCNYDLKHCMYVAELSGAIYDQTIHLHNLDDQCREYLKAAAILHDIGYHISHTNHHHHSYYIIKNSELLGFTETEISIIAHTARYHRKSHPKNSHLDYMALNDETKAVINKLSAILRIADSFDRTHRQFVSNVDVKTTNSKVEFTINHDKDNFPEIELWSNQRRKILFEQLFNKSVSVKTVANL